MNAVILCGGFGKRLAPLTNDLPKPMLSVAGRPMLDYCFAQLGYYGITDVTLTLAYLPEKIIDWTKGYSDFNLSYSVEELPLGTAGGVKNAEKNLSDVFVVVSGDGLNNIDLDQMYQTHVKNGADVTMAITQSFTPWLYGVVEHEDGYVKQFFEKPNVSGKRWINTGVYIVNKYVLDFVQKDVMTDFSKDLFPLVLNNGRIAVYEHDGYWSDIGDFASYYKANMDMIKGGFYRAAKNEHQTSFDLFGSMDISLVAHSASVVGRISGCVVGERARVTSSAVLDRCVVLDGSVVKGRHSDCIISGNMVIDVSDLHSPLKNKNFKKSFTTDTK
ncbi:MAG: NDP-sugar synthase [Clostridiales bacterium]|nr:NDP-sugar synthase [Clostridiales bacterium]